MHSGVRSLICDLPGHRFLPLTRNKWIIFLLVIVLGVMKDLIFFNVQKFNYTLLILPIFALVRAVI